MANAWKRENKTPKLFSLLSLSLLAIIVYFSFTFIPPKNQQTLSPSTHTFQSPQQLAPQSLLLLPPFDCSTSPQAHPIIANRVESLKYPFIYSLADLGSLPEKPHKNIVRLLKGKPFRKPDISATIQEVLEGKSRSGLVVDVGANVGMASFAAAVMGFRVVAFEPVLENLQRICDGVWFNRLADLVTVFNAAASDRNGTITFHKLVGRLDNSAVSATGARVAFKSNEEIAVEVRTIPVDAVVSDSEPVAVVKIDVQGWEYHVLKGAKKLLSRKKDEAPYVIYEEDERLLNASNTTSKEIRDFLLSVGYNQCTQHGTDAHCTKI